jgi:hypothetical protein
MSIFHKAQSYAINNFFSVPEPNRGLEKINGQYHRVFGSKDFEEPGKVDYKFNSYGIRSKEFDLDHDLVAVGCSFTYGTGIPENARWADILADKLNVSVANLSFPGAPIEMIIGNLFKYLNIKDKDPKYIAVLLPDFLRVSYLRNQESSVLVGLSLDASQHKFSYNQDKDILSSILPIEWAYFKAQESVKMLELYCKAKNIKLVWSTWSTIKIDSEWLSHKFLCYKKDKTIDEFPDQDIDKFWTDDEIAKKRYFEYDNMSCHKEYLEEHSEYFYYAYDRLPRTQGDALMFQPHPGMHRNLHWANFFYEELINEN